MRVEERQPQIVLGETKGLEAGDFQHRAARSSSNSWMVGNCSWNEPTNALTSPPVSGLVHLGHEHVIKTTGDLGIAERSGERAVFDLHLADDVGYRRILRPLDDLAQMVFERRQSCILVAVESGVDVLFGWHRATIQKVPDEKPVSSRIEVRLPGKRFAIDLEATVTELNPEPAEVIEFPKPAKACSEQ